MAEKNWKEMNGWEKTCEVTLVVTGFAVMIGGLLLSKASHGTAGRKQGSRGGTGGSVWTVGHGGKKSGSWSSGRHS